MPSNVPLFYKKIIQGKHDSAIYYTNFQSELDMEKPVFIHVPGWMGFLDKESEWVQYLSLKSNFIYILPPINSPKRPEQRRFSLVERILDLRLIVDYYNLDSKFYLLSNSVGSGVATIYDVLFPKSAKALIMFVPEFRRTLSLLEIIFVSIPPALSKRVKRLLPVVLRMYADTEKDQRQARNMLRMVLSANIQAMRKSALNVFRAYDVTRYLSRVTAPVIAYGARSDKLHGLESLRVLKQHVPKAIIRFKETNSEIYSQSTIQELLDLLEVISKSKRIK